MVGALLQQAVLVVFIVSGLPLLASSLVAGVVALVQTVTQIQEQTMVHVLRVLVCTGVIFVSAPFSIDLFESLLESALKSVATIGLGRP